MFLFLKFQMLSSFRIMQLYSFIVVLALCATTWCSAIPKPDDHKNRVYDKVSTVFKKIVMPRLECKIFLCLHCGFDSMRVSPKIMPFLVQE